MPTSISGAGAGIWRPLGAVRVRLTWPVVQPAEKRADAWSSGTVTGAAWSAPLSTHPLARCRGLLCSRCWASSAWVTARSLMWVRMVKRPPVSNAMPLMRATSTLPPRPTV